MSAGRSAPPEAPADFSGDLARFLGHDVANLWEWPECALCGATERVTVVREGFARCPLEIVRCACGFCYSRPRPTALLADLIRRPATRNALVDAGLLPEARRVHTAALFDYRKQLHHDANYRAGLYALQRLKSGGVLLDVGCAGGRFVQLAREAGYEAVGVDLEEEPVRWGRRELGLDLRLMEPGRLPDDLPPLDIVTLWNVLEHVPDPLELLRAIRAAMVPDGLLLIDVPNFAFRLAAARITGVYEPPEQRFFPYDHLSHFTATTLARALREAGFRPLRFDAMHTDGARGQLPRLRRAIMRAVFHLSGGLVNWHHPLSCLARCGRETE